MESERLETRLGPLAWRSSGRGPALVFFVGPLLLLILYIVFAPLFTVLRQL